MTHAVGLIVSRYARQVLRETFGQPAQKSDKLPALWAIVSGSAGNNVLAPVCAQPGHLHIVSEGYLDGPAVDTTTLTKAEVQWLSVVASVLAMCGGGDTKKPVNLPKAEEAPEGPHLLADVIDNMGNALLSRWRPTSTAPLWVCKAHFGEGLGTK